MGKKKKSKKPQIIYQYLQELSVKEGVDFLHTHKNRGRNKGKIRDYIVVMGQNVKADPRRFNVLRTNKLTCFQCGCHITHFVISKHRNDFHWPFALNAFSGAKMLTWDHIIPQSLGGSDHVSNSRIACARCNETRGNWMSMSDLLWVLKQNPDEMYSQEDFKPAKDILGMIGSYAKQAKNAVPVYTPTTEESCDIIT